MGPPVLLGVPVPLVPVTDHRLAVPTALDPVPLPVEVK